MFSRITVHMRRNTVAYVALFFALSGSAIAAKPLITGADVRDDSLTGADVLESSLGQVGDADKLDGKDSSAFGAPNAVVAATPVDGQVYHFGTALAELANITVGAGTWVIVAKATVGTFSATGGEADCYLASNNTRFDTSTTSLGTGETATLPLATVQTFSAETTISMRCRDTRTSTYQSAYALYPSLAAIRAG